MSNLQAKRQKIKIHGLPSIIQIKIKNLKENH